ncbi:hypothetical protein JKP88DRAFT_273600 [Tribonema minus]|uniref:C2H2-type domain-containing protein n=1 Tax=Tribonema minus TaxID=303371 RepID=A0A835YTI1_9STRA|nr:hypothetical protein JKP88DRAFT_273600 [Tribonema minus]
MSISSVKAMRLTTVYLVDYENSCQSFVPADCFILGSPTCEDPAAVTSAVILFKAPSGEDADAAGTISDYWRYDTLVRVATCLTTNPEAADTHLVLAASSLMFRSPTSHPGLQGLALAPPEELNVRLVHGGDRRYGELGAALRGHGGFKSFSVVNGTAQRLEVAPTAADAAAEEARGGAGVAAVKRKKTAKAKASKSSALSPATSPVAAAPAAPATAVSVLAAAIVKAVAAAAAEAATAAGAPLVSVAAAVPAVEAAPAEGILQCQECNHLCPNLAALRAHMCAEHRDKLLSCAACAAADQGATKKPPLLFMAGELTAHTQHRHGAYVCFACAPAAAFATAAQLRGHQRMAHVHLCPLCSKRCCMVMGVAMHLQQVHCLDAFGVRGAWAAATTAAAAAATAAATTAAAEAVERWQCPYCSCPCADGKALRAHVHAEHCFKQLWGCECEGGLEGRALLPPPRQRGAMPPPPPPPLSSAQHTMQELGKAVTVPKAALKNKLRGGGTVVAAAAKVKRVKNLCLKRYSARQCRSLQRLKEFHQRKRAERRQRTREHMAADAAAAAAVSATALAPAGEHDGSGGGFVRCRECHHLEADVEALRAHARAAHRGALHECATCDATRRPPPLMAEDMSAHWRSRHGAHVCFACADACVFEDAAALRRHQRAAHGHTCPLCAKRFCTLHDAAAHLLRAHRLDVRGAPRAPPPPPPGAAVE